MVCGLHFFDPADWRDEYRLTGARHKNPLPHEAIEGKKLKLIKKPYNQMHIAKMTIYYMGTFTDQQTARIKQIEFFIPGSRNKNIELAQRLTH